MNELIRSLRGLPQSEKKQGPSAHDNLKESKSVQADEDTAAAEEDSRGDESSHISDSIISQPPLTEAGESTEEGGLKQKRARTTFYSPDIRPDIVIVRESNEEQLGLEEDPMHPFSRKRRPAQRLQLDSLEEDDEEDAKQRFTDRRPKRSRKATEFLRPDPRPDIVVHRESNRSEAHAPEIVLQSTNFAKMDSLPNAGIIREPNPEKESLESEGQGSLSQVDQHAMTGEIWVNAQRKGSSPEIAAVRKPKLASVVPNHVYLRGQEGLTTGENGKQGKGGLIEREEKTTSGAIDDTPAQHSNGFIFVLSHDDDSSEEERRERMTKKTRAQIQNNAKLDIDADDSLFGESSRDERKTKALGGLHKRNGVGRDSHIEYQQTDDHAMHPSRKVDIPLSRRARRPDVVAKGAEIHRGRRAGMIENSRDHSISKTVQEQQGSRVSPFGRKANVIGKSVQSSRNRRDGSGEKRGTRATSKSKRTSDQQMSDEGFSGKGDNSESSSEEKYTSGGIAVKKRECVRATETASSGQTKIKQEETSEVGETERYDEDAAFDAGLEAGSGLAPNDPILARLAKAKKEPRRRSGLTVGLENGGPQRVSDMLDDKSGIAFRASVAILCKVDSKAALEFCQRCLEDYYGKAEKVVEALMGGDTFAKRCTLMDTRITITGLWCACARLLLSVADGFSADKTPDVRKPKHQFGHLNTRDLPKIRKALIDTALMVLGKAATCPLVGNHAWIALSYSKIIQAAFLKSGYSADDGDTTKVTKAHRSFHAAGALCQQSLGNPRRGEQYLDQRILDRLVEAGIIHESTIVGLFGGAKIENSVLGTVPTCVDKPSEALLRNELDMLDTMQAVGNSSNKTMSTTNQSLASLLSRLPLSSGEVWDHRFIYEPPQSNTDHSYSRADATAAAGSYTMIAETHQRVESEVYSFNSMYCFGIEMIGQDLPKETRKSRMWEVQQCENEHSVIHSFHVQDKLKSAIIDGCQDVTFYCPSCGPSATFRSQGALQDHMNSCCSILQPVAGIEERTRNRFRFGSSSLIGDWTKHSIDPENGPLLSPDELLDVLDYSVEFFEVQKEHVSDSGCKKREYSLTSPRFHGQYGLRCQHCRDDWEDFGVDDSFVFPESIDKLPQAFWYLSLTHLDNCEHQPRAVQHWHQEYRKHVRLNSFLPSEYWTNMAAEMNLVSTQAGGLTSHGNRVTTES